MRLLFFLFLFVTTSAAQFTGDWETITNMNDIRDLKYDEGRIWAATTGGIYSLGISDETIQKLTNIDGLLSISVESIETDHHGNLIYGGKSGILEVRSKDNGNTYQLFNIESNSINEILFHNDTLWVAAGKGIAVFVYTEAQYKFKDFYKNFDILPDAVTSVEIFAGRVWLGTDKGVLTAPSAFDKYTINDPALWKLYDIRNGLTDNQILDFSVINNQLWAGTSEGITIIDSNSNVSQEIDWGPEEAPVIMSTVSRVIIAGAFNKLYEYNSISGFKNQINSFGSEITAVIGDSEGNLWTGLSQSGLYRAETGQRIVIDGPVQNAIRYVIKDFDKNFWMSSGKVGLYNNNSISVFDGFSWTSYKYSGTGWYAHGNSVYLYQDPQQNIWIGSWGGGLMGFNGDFFYFHNYTTPGQLRITKGDTVNTLMLGDDENVFYGYFNGVVGAPTYEVVQFVNTDNYNRLWIANWDAADDNLISVVPFDNSGFINLDMDEWIRLGRNERLTMQDGAITCIAFDDFNRAWIGTFKDGVYVLEYDNNGNFSYAGNLNTSDNLYGNTVLSIASDQDGIIWIGTSAGLNSFDGVNVYKHVGDSEGLAGPLENQINQIVVDKYNNKWFATTGGLSILRGERSPWDETAWIGFTAENSGLVDNDVNTVFVDSDGAEALIGTENGLSVYRGTFAEIQDDYSKVTGGPNPFYPGTENMNFVLTNLEFNSTVNIYTLNGQLVKTLTASNGYVDGSRATWDGRDLNGKLVASGIYLYMASTEEGNSTAGKFAVVRK